MSKILGTYNQLLLIRKEIQEYSANSMTFGLFNAEKIKRFFTYNSIRLKIADEKNQPIELEDKEGFVKWEHIDENARIAFDIEYKDFMHKQINIEF
jgi:hypothetical protein